MNKNIKIFLAFLLVVVVIGTAYFFVTQKKNTPVPSQTTDQTFNWKTYTNSKSTFSIKLPPNWFVHTGIIGNEMVMYYPVDNPSRQNFLEDKTITMLVVAYQNTERKTLFQEAEKVIKESKSLFIEDNKVANQNYITLTSKAGRSLMAMTHYQTLTYIFSVNGDVEKNRSTIDQILSTFKFITPTASTDTSNWTLYTNKTFGYILKFPTNYEVAPQTEKEISQKGIDSNICIKRKLNNTRSVLIDFWENIGNLSLKDYVNNNLNLFGITGPLVNYNFNGYDSLLNKNQSETDVFVKQGQYVYHISASTASSDKEVGDIVATFKFTQ